MRRLTMVAVVLLAGLMVAMQPAWSQEVTANIVGTVTDATGSAVKGAAVVATDVDRGTVFNTLTNGDGAYNLLRLPISTYTVKITAPGFDTVSHAPFTLVLNQTARIDVQLKVGKISEAVEVVGSTPLLQTETTEVSTVIDAHTNVSLPLASRNYLQLTLLAPGVTNVDPDGMRQANNMLNSGRPYINGNREQANEYLVDGILNSEDKNNETGLPAHPRRDSGIQPDHAECLRRVWKLSRRSGQRCYEIGNEQLSMGCLYEFLRNDAFDAHEASDGWTQGVDNGVLGFNAEGVLNKAELRYNQFGGTFGGPIIKNKLFFFADYQGQRQAAGGYNASTGVNCASASRRFWSALHSTSSGSSMMPPPMMAIWCNADQLRNREQARLASCLSCAEAQSPAGQPISVQ